MTTRNRRAGVETYKTPLFVTHVRSVAKRTDKRNESLVLVTVDLCLAALKSQDPQSLTGVCFTHDLTFDCKKVASGAAIGSGRQKEDE